MRAFALLLIICLAGCTGSPQKGNGIDLKEYCDRAYQGDIENATIIGVFGCENGYRLVFDSPNHQDYYLNARGDFSASCPPAGSGKDCEALLATCRFANLCR